MLEYFSKTRKISTQYPFNFIYVKITSIFKVFKINGVYKTYHTFKTV